MRKTTNVAGAGAVSNSGSIRGAITPARIGVRISAVRLVRPEAVKILKALHNMALHEWASAACATAEFPSVLDPHLDDPAHPTLCRDGINPLWRPGIPLDIAPNFHY